MEKKLKELQAETCCAPVARTTLITLYINIEPDLSHIAEGEE